MNTNSVGLIGVGLLGSALANRLMKDGRGVHGFDTNEEQLQALSQCGGIACDSAAEVVQNCDVLILSLPTSDVVLSLVRQLRTDFEPSQIVVDTTTGDPQQMIAVGQSLAELGVSYLEATVAGSSAQVTAGEAALLLGGDAEVVESVKPLLAAITSKHFWFGPVGTASRFKLVHNLVLGLHRAVLAEGLVFAESLGFDPNQVLEILKQTPAASRVMEIKGRRMVEGDYGIQARLSQHLKDVRLILAEAERAGANTPLSRIHQTILEHAAELGFGDADNSAVIEAFRHPNDAEDS
ncbi:2-(hydroxymethyl)glutarate dehydrogenase [Novipirellula artificiosorum]|uniref:2-(Hydroxymethyl)glutarate dehydrogenase n=2 Tax=Novipirellula artificiosorum TaxID=2528016 RepID=A0A5C6DUV6_9BACT|nr:2-(hydroxymethyl)glutarate dehydrogenase [Novipirellula artificiosorum]